VDLDWPETVTAAIAGVDLVVDPVPHPALTAERAVLRDGGALIDVSMRPAAATRRLRAEAADPQGAVALNAGRIPGISNLVVYELLAAHPDADAIEIVFSFTAGAAAGRAAGESLHRLLTSARRRSTAVFPFPAPMWIAVRRHGTLLDARTITGHRRCWTPCGHTAFTRGASNLTSCSACPNWRKTSGKQGSRSTYSPEPAVERLPTTLPRPRPHCCDDCSCSDRGST
jgi:hypothetical protein